MCKEIEKGNGEVGDVHSQTLELGRFSHILRTFCRLRRRWWWLTLNLRSKSGTEFRLTTSCEHIEDLLGFLARQVPIANRKRGERGCGTFYYGEQSG